MTLPSREQPIVTLRGDWIRKLRTLPARSVQMIITSPPYWGLRDYQTKGQLGLEATPKQYIEKLRKGFRECWRVLRDDGTLWVNIGDKSYNYRPGKALDDRRHDFKTHPRDIPKVHASRKNRIKGVKEKDIFGLPWRLAFALQDDGWILRQDNIWSKPNPLPESAKDRPARSHEYVFLLTKKKRYYYDWFSVQEPSTGTSKPRTKYKPEAGQHPEIFPELPETFKPGTHKVPGVTPKASTPEANGNEIRHRANAEYSAHLAGDTGALRNWRSVWTVHVHPFSESAQSAHWVHEERGAISDGNRYIASIDCPVYGGLFDLAAMAFYDGHEDQTCDHTWRIDDYLSLTPRDGFSPIGRDGGWNFGEQNLGSIFRRYFETATGHNMRNRKTDLFLSTRLVNKPSAQRTRHILDILKARGLSERDLDNVANNTWVGEFSDNQKPKTIWCTVGKGNLLELREALGHLYARKLRKTSHFATFPPELIRKPILAGTSEKGACIKCGTPWSRIVSRGEPDRDLQRASGGSLTGGYRGQGRKDYKPARAQNPSEVKRRILEGMKLKRSVGWRQNCKCETSETRPCIVLDPFFGSGTTGKVAMEYGRWCIGIELSPESVKLAEARINTTQGFNFA